MRGVNLISTSLRSFHPHEDHLEPLLEGSLVVDSRELIGRRLVNQVIGAARIVHVAQLDEDLCRRTCLGGFGFGDVDRPGIGIGRVQLPAGFYAQDFQDVTAIGAQPFAFQPLSKPGLGVAASSGWFVALAVAGGASAGEVSPCRPLLHQKTPAAADSGGVAFRFVFRDLLISGSVISNQFPSSTWTVLPATGSILLLSAASVSSGLADLE